MRLFKILSLLTLTLVLAAPAYAQSKKTQGIPDVPDALQSLADRGAQFRYLGNEHGMDGWIAIYQGQEQYYYITQDKKAFVTGLMFADDGRPITIDQVKTLQAAGGDVLDLLAEDKTPEETSTPTSVVESAAMKTPAERMFGDVEASNWIRLGSEDAPAIYSFVDPNCPHCHDFLNDIRQKDYLAKNVLQVRIIPVGFQTGSLAQASFLLASPDAQERYFKYLDGDKDQLPAKSDISTQAVQKNMALMQAWKFNVTPLTVYRSKSGEIKIVRGRAKDLNAIISDLQAPKAP
ncbi:MAG: thiol:disulfide interchange protein DsbG [Micavibrio aeruginosavorus]|uniref:Thiol:disulfide interchange protein DsbG n=1 Tax=Micavibrio aeruginosavorus TaxID=349221 RepID=A0A2W5N6L4_9BACT|nr:MAG: thiol:disulfide interchange protein DsbG [Micavibrio aeruginosavorus]